MFGESNDNENENENEVFDVEGILPTMALDFSIPSDLFSQYIDANFPSIDEEEDCDATQFHSVEEVFASQHDKSRNVEQTSDEVINPVVDDVTDLETLTPETEKPDSGADEMSDKFEEEDMEIETDEAILVVEEKFVDESKSTVDDDGDQVVNIPTEDVVQKLTDVEEKHATVEPNPQNVETFDFRSLIAAAKYFKREFSKKPKSVRFLTPQKGDVLSYDANGANDDTDDEDDGKENVKELPECAAALVSVNIPVK
jgi:hypothetical protein